jgi:aerobic carbon-monoxide dehydrogenase medium subunit
VEEAVSLLREHGDEAKVIAGGQSLVPMMAFRLATPSALIDLNAVSSLDYARMEDDRLVLGALARHRSVEQMADVADRCPMIHEGVSAVGHVAIRNRGTVAGSLAHADPSAEWPALLVAVDGEVTVIGPSGSRIIAGRDLFASYFTTTLQPDEILTEVRMPLPNGGRVGSAFMELSRRHGDFAIAGVAAFMEMADGGAIEDAGIALIGVGDTPVRAARAEEILRGGASTDQVLQGAAEAVDPDIAPMSDVHGSAEYRRHVAKVLTGRALARARDRAGPA